MIGSLYPSFSGQAIPSAFFLFRLADTAWEVKKLIPLDAQLAEEIYKALFAYSEDSDARTQIGNSRIFVMTSTKKQDYYMVQYNLVEEFPKFIKTAPENAVHALICAVESYIDKYHSNAERIQEEIFDYNGIEARIKADHSSIWDGNHNDLKDEPLKMLDSFEKYLIESTQSKESIACRHKIEKIIAKENNSAVVWRRLLRCGIKSPSTIGLEIKSLAWTKPILTCRDTEIVVGDLIKSIFGLLDAKDRERIETAILSLTENNHSDEELKFRERDRNRLVGCLPKEYIVTDIVRKIFLKLEIKRAFPPNEPGFRLTGWTSEPYDKTAPDLMWEIIENTCEKEQSRGVLQGLLSYTFNRIAGANANRISSLAKKIFNRVIDGAGADSVRKECVNIFCGLYVWQGNQASKEVIDAIVSSPKDYLKETQCLVVNARELLTHGLDNSNNQEYKNIRKRAFTLVEKILSSVSMEVNKEDSKLKTKEELTNNEVETLRGLIETIDSIASMLYFASGAFDETQNQDKQNRKVLTIDEKKQFLCEAANLLNQLADIGFLPSVTYYLVEILEAFILLNPVNIFEKIGKIVKKAQQGDYQYESFAADLIVKIIERYLSEYRWVFRDHLNCQQTLLEILDIFANAGWLSAKRLTYRLEEIYR